MSWLNTYSLALLCLSSVTLLTPDAAAGATNPDGERVPTNRSAQVPVQEFQITAERFQFAPSTIEVNQGDTVRLVVRSVDVAHGFRIEGHDVEALIPGGAVWRASYMMRSAVPFLPFSMILLIVCWIGTELNFGSAGVCRRSGRFRRGMERSFRPSGR